MIMNKIKILAVSFLLILTCCSDDDPVKKKTVTVDSVIATGNDVNTSEELTRLFSETAVTTSIPINSTFVVSFSKDIAEETATPTNIEITKNGDAIPVDIFVDGKTVIITPEDELELETNYVLSFSSSIKAADGGIFTETTRDFSTQDNPLEDGLVAHYTFESGLAQDKSGMGNNGVITGAQSVMDKDNRENEALKFDSENNRVYVASPAFLNNTVGTFAAWVKFDNLDNIQYLASVGDEGNTTNYMAFIRIDATDHSIGTYWRNDAEVSWLKSSTTVVTGVYYHIVLVADGEEFKMYVNGEEVELGVVQGSNTGKWIAQINSLDNFVIGNVALLAPHPLPNVAGNLDEIRIYDRALSAREISLLHTMTK
jgi:hypothetical protein